MQRFTSLFRLINNFNVMPKLKIMQNKSANLILSVNMYILYGIYIIYIIITYLYYNELLSFSFINTEVTLKMIFYSIYLFVKYILLLKNNQ